jgi:hypothetical protein
MPFVLGCGAVLNFCEIEFDIVLDLKSLLRRVYRLFYPCDFKFELCGAKA